MFFQKLLKLAASPTFFGMPHIWILHGQKTYLKGFGVTLDLKNGVYGLDDKVPGDRLNMATEEDGRKKGTQKRTRPLRGRFPASFLTLSLSDTQTLSRNFVLFGRRYSKNLFQTLLVPRK